MQFTGNGTVPAPATGAGPRTGPQPVSGATLSLTGTGTFIAGSSFFNTPLDSHHLIVSFDSTIGGGSGADGQTFVLADPRGRYRELARLPRRRSRLLGHPGHRVALDTYKSSVNPSTNFVGITDGPTSGGPDPMHWLATAQPCRACAPNATSWSNS